MIFLLWVKPKSGLYRECPVVSSLATSLASPPITLPLLVFTTLTYLLILKHKLNPTKGLYTYLCCFERSFLLITLALSFTSFRFLLRYHCVREVFSSSHSKIAYSSLYSLFSFSSPALFFFMILVTI